MDLIVIVVFIIVIFIIIVGIILYTCIKKTGNGNDNIYYGTGDVNIVKTEFASFKAFLRSANKISDYIQSPVTFKATSDYSAELKFKHGGYNIQISAPAIHTLNGVVIINKDSTMYYYFRQNVMQKISKIYKQFAKCDSVEAFGNADFLTQEQFEEQTAIMAESVNSYQQETTKQAAAAAASTISIDIQDEFSGKKGKQTFNISSEMTFSDLFDNYRRTHPQYYITTFTYTGRDLNTYPTGYKIQSKISSSGNTIFAIGFKIYNENEMVEFIKNQTVKSTPILHIEPPFKIIVTMPSGPSGVMVLWHVKNKAFNWNKICDRVFGLTGEVKMHIAEERVMNNIIFYHISLELFAECLGTNGIEYDTPDKLLKLVEGFVEKTDPDYNTKMHIIQILFGVMSGYGIQSSHSDDSVLNEHVTNAYSEYAEMMYG